MDKSEKIEFKVGEKYENEIGVFEVTSIKGDRMVMQQETGAEIITDINLQRRIQERRLWEKLVREKNVESAAAKSRRATKGRPGKIYEGLQSLDFRNKISGTGWRSREQLGGAVTAQLMSAQFNFGSWAARRQNEIHWADAARWKADQNACPSKFFARADETSFAWGFYIERPDDNHNTSADWEAFIAWLRADENDQWLRGVALEEGLEVYDTHQSCFGGVIRARETDWAVEGSSVRKSASSLGACIDSWPASAWLHLMIAKRIPKADAVARASAIAQDVAKLLDRLLPLYDAAVTRPQ
jgi:hypothetical protein